MFSNDLQGRRVNTAKSPASVTPVYASWRCRVNKLTSFDSISSSDQVTTKHCQYPRLAESEERVRMCPDRALPVTALTRVVALYFVTFDPQPRRV
jgi:hypothetical protein